MPSEKVHDEPSKVEFSEGAVLVRCPDGYAVSMTPDAAVVTGTRLIETAAKAVGDHEFEEDIKRRSTQRRKR